MNTIPIGLAWFAQVRPLISNLQAGLLLTLLGELCQRRELLPLDIEEVRHLARVRSRDEERELDRLLERFFNITEGGRVPADPAALILPPRLLIAGARDAGDVTQTSLQRHVIVTRNAPHYEKETQRLELGKDRQKRHRERVTLLRDEAVTRGLHPRKNASLSELQLMLESNAESDVTRNANVTHNADSRDSCARAPGIPSFNTNTEIQGARSVLPSVTPTPAGAAARAMRQAGIADVNPSHPGLLALIESGMTADELADIARECIAKGKGFAYALAVAKGRRLDASKAEAIPAKRDFIAELAGPELAARLGREVQ